MNLRQAPENQRKSGERVTHQAAPTEVERIHPPGIGLRSPADKYGKLSVPLAGKKIHLDPPAIRNLRKKAFLEGKEPQLQ